MGVRLRGHWADEWQLCHLKTWLPQLVAMLAELDGVAGRAGTWLQAPARNMQCLLSQRRWLVGSFKQDERLAPLIDSIGLKSLTCVCGQGFVSMVHVVPQGCSPPFRTSMRLHMPRSTFERYPLLWDRLPEDLFRGNPCF